MLFCNQGLRSRAVIDALPCIDQRTIALGNMIADEHAKAAVAECHEQASGALQNEVACRIKRAEVVMRVIAKVMALFETPRAPGQQQADKQRKTEDRLRESARLALLAKEHKWADQAKGDGWFCTECLLVWHRSSKRPARTECSGSALTPTMRTLLADFRGHRLQFSNVHDDPGSQLVAARRGVYVPRNHSTVISCTTCGAYATSRPVNLLERCRGPPSSHSSGQTVLSRVRSGIHPATKSLRLEQTVHAESVQVPGQDGAASVDACRKWADQCVPPQRTTLDRPVRSTSAHHAGPIGVTASPALCVPGSPESEWSETQASEELAELQKSGLRVAWPLSWKPHVAASSGERHVYEDLAAAQSQATQRPGPHRSVRQSVASADITEEEQALQDLHALQMSGAAVQWPW